MSEWERFLAIGTLVVYFLFDYFDGRRISDEREELIRLKSLEFAHKASLAVLATLALAYIFNPAINVQVVILALIASALYGEVAAKIFYRWKL
jgi:hypothetical protein